MGNHRLLNRHGIDITTEDTWQALIVSALPDGIALKKICLNDLLNHPEHLDIILPLGDILAPIGIIEEVLALIIKRIGRVGVWADSSVTTQQLDALLALSKDQDTGLLSALELVVLYTPLFSDGRNFSFAKYLRLQGYDGEIRLAGEFGRDQIVYFYRSGVDSFIIANEQLTKDIKQAFFALPTAYSGNTVEQLPMFRSLKPNSHDHIANNL